MDRTENEAGQKLRQREDIEDRAAVYRDFRFGWGEGLCVCDLDQVEYRWVKGKPVPVGVLELTRVDPKILPLPQSYLDGVVRRYNSRDAQGAAVRTLAAKLNVQAWIVLFNTDCSLFWVYNLSRPYAKWFRELNQATYRKWIEGLKPGKPTRKK